MGPLNDQLSSMFWKFLHLNFYGENLHGFWGIFLHPQTFRHNAIDRYSYCLILHCFSFSFSFSFMWVLACSYHLHPTMAPSKIVSSINPSSIESPLKVSSSKNVKDLSNHKVIRPTCMEPMFLREYWTFENLSRGLIRSFFTNIPNWMFLRFTI